jgi:hypothetical protein
VTGPRLNLTRPQILAFHRHVGALNERLPPGPDSLRRAAWAGLQDSMPRAALLSIHARVRDTAPSTWEDPSLVQLWGPRFNTYVVAAQDHALFSLARLPDDARGLKVAQDMARRLDEFLDGRKLPDREAGAALGVGNGIRYATTTGTVVIRWEGARAPLVWTVPPPTIDPLQARLELARRYLHIFGPTTPEAFSKWAGISSRQGQATFDALGDSLTPVRTPIGDRWILSTDEATFSDASTAAARAAAAPARLLPSGDAYWLLQGADRELLVPDAHHRAALWTTRVWPGALLVGPEIVGTWRRANEKLTISTWRPLSRAEIAAVEEEAVSLPLPGVQGRISVRWD